MILALVYDADLPPKNYGGTERVVLSLAKEYRRAGHKVLLVCRQGSTIQDFDAITLPTNFSVADVERAVPADCDFLHFHQPIPVEPHRPYLVTIHGNGQVGERYLPNTNFLSQSHARNHNGRYYVYNGVEPSEFPFVREKEDYFVFLARAKWRVKNVKTAIALANDLGTRLEIIGGEGLSKGLIRYRGSLSEKEGKLELLSKAKALLYPTNWDEPFGLALLEAWSCGTPVITSVNGAMSELVQPGAGVGFKCQTYAEMLEAARRLDSLRPEDCRRYVEENFSAEKMAASYLKLIEEIRAHGKFEQNPAYNFDPESVRLIYKPTAWNRLRLKLTGKV
jgi:glycosyltransferase involved in cell wall biosynthesis